MSADPSAASDYCRDLVRQWGHDRYLAGLLAPQALRDHLWAIYAFDAEIARVRSAVSDAMLGDMRYQWWRERIDELYEGTAGEHPVLTLLGRAIAAADLPKQAFVNLIEARRFDLYDDPMPELNDLEGYLGETSSVPMQLAARVLAGEAALAMADAAGLAGVAYGLTRLLCELPAHRARGQCYIPHNLLANYDLTPAHVLSGRREAGLDIVVSQLRHHAAMRLAEARKRIADVAVPALPALWPASLAELYLKRIARPGFDPFTTAAHVSQFRRQVRLVRLSLTEAY